METEPEWFPNEGDRLWWRETHMKVREHIGRCAGSIRHWWTLHTRQGGGVGVNRAICGHCRAIHPDIMKALLRGRYYLQLYDPPDDSPDYPHVCRAIERDAKLLDSAIERVDHERKA